MPYATYSPSYTPFWQGQLTAPYQQMGYAQQPMTLPQSQQTVQQGASKVDGPAEAMNRFLMQYPAQSLVPGFVSWPPLFDVNGRQFYTLSIEPDGRRNLETFDYMPHSQSAQVNINGVTFNSREEFDTFAAKVMAVIGEATNGIHGPVQAAPATVPTAGTASAAQGADGPAPLDAAR